MIAFQDYQPFLGIMHSDWVGFSNFATLYFDPDFWNALKNTLGLALVVDSLINTKIRRWFQSMVYLPHFLSWVLVCPVPADARRRRPGEQ